MGVLVPAKTMRVGVVSCNIYARFTNYGSALQSWALCKAIRRMGDYEPVLIDYCPDCLLGVDLLDPASSMKDSDEESKRQLELSLPAIHVNARKFKEFYATRFNRTKRAYCSNNFNDVMADESLSGFVCGSDTIFCPDEFGVDDGYWANYRCMQGHSVAYAPSFGDPHFTEGKLADAAARARNFLAIAPREKQLAPFLREYANAPVRQAVDPTLLLQASDYDELIADPRQQDDYLLLYSRRYDPALHSHAERLASERGWEIVEISLRAENAVRHSMRYDAGVEEFLSLVKGARFLVTNSYHGMLFALQFHTPFSVFTREQGEAKIIEVLKLAGLTDRLIFQGHKNNEVPMDIDWRGVESSLAPIVKESQTVLQDELSLLRAAAEECS